MSGATYLDVSAVQKPFSIGPDENQRELVSCNFTVKRVDT
jgi:hypothetical protein